MSDYFNNVKRVYVDRTDEKTIASVKKCPSCNGSRYEKDSEGNFVLDERGNKISCSSCGGDGYIDK